MSKKGTIIFNWTFLEDGEEITEHQKAILLLAEMKKREKEEELEISEKKFSNGHVFLSRKYKKKPKS